jgi:hypothetical protein
MKPNINSVEVHPQLSNNGHPLDGALVGASSLWPDQEISHIQVIEYQNPKLNLQIQ